MSRRRSSPCHRCGDGVWKQQVTHPFILAEERLPDNTPTHSPDEQVCQQVAVQRCGRITEIDKDPDREEHERRYEIAREKAEQDIRSKFHSIALFPVPEMGLWAQIGGALFPIQHPSLGSGLPAHPRLRLE
ncbi:MAG: hypothetical protein IBX64_11375 [Actinobacteria bacterium]|nr:hypothetical protein [Actinomycetota bacterium]